MFRVVDDYDAYLFVGYRKNNIYIIDMLNLVSNTTFLIAINEEPWV